MINQKLLLVTLALVLKIANSALVPVEGGNDDKPQDNDRVLDLKMKGAHPSMPDAYLCSAYDVSNIPEDQNYITQFEAMAESSVAHHILVFGCDGGPARRVDVWPCPQICDYRAKEQIMFAWAKNAPPTHLPKDVGIRIGRGSSIKTIVIQIHYKHKFNATMPKDHTGIRVTHTPKRQKYVAGIHLMYAFQIKIPPHKPEILTDVSCNFNKDYTMHPFAFRTHAHGLGKVISGYLYNGSWHQIGKGNPQWPQAFYPVTSDIVVKPNDKLFARCVYDSTNSDVTTRVGSTGEDEMCNFYIMFYTDSSVKVPSGNCVDNNLPRLDRQMPADSKVPMPHNDKLEEEAKDGHHHHHYMHTNTQLPESTGKPHEKLDPVLFDGKWPAEDLKLGQVGGVATDKEGNVYIFHRGSRRWNDKSFDVFHKFQGTEPIPEEVIVILDKHGKVIRKFGSNQFYMPHGIEIDSKGNIWVTDVALHQVMRIPKGKSAPDLFLGKTFQPGSDNEHFCKPSDVAVLESGDFFVSDGYCNSRVLKYSANATLLDEWGQNDFLAYEGKDSPPGAFNVVHSITVAEDKNLVCAADRENGRIQCFDLDGNFRFIIKNKQFGTRLFAIDYCPQHGGVLFAVNGPTFDNSHTKVQGFTVDVDSQELLQLWNTSPGLKNPHDVTVDSVNHAIYVGELDPPRVWRLHMKGQDVTTSKGTSQAHGKVSSTELPAPNNEVISEQTTGIAEKVGKKSDVMPSIIIGVLLVVPVVLLLLITVVVRLHHSGKISCCGGKKQKVFSLQNILGNSHKGFDRLSTEESDHELDPLDDSDQDEYIAPRRKTKA